MWDGVNVIKVLDMKHDVAEIVYEPNIEGCDNAVVKITGT